MIHDHLHSNIPGGIYMKFKLITLLLLLVFAVTACSGPADTNAPSSDSSASITEESSIEEISQADTPAEEQTEASDADISAEAAEIVDTAFDPFCDVPSDVLNRALEAAANWAADRNYEYQIKLYPDINYEYDVITETHYETIGGVVYYSMPEEGLDEEYVVVYVKYIQGTNHITAFTASHQSPLYQEDLFPYLFSNTVLPGLEDAVSIALKGTLVEENEWFNSSYIYTESYNESDEYAHAQCRWLPGALKLEGEHLYDVQNDSVTIYQSHRIPEVYPESIAGYPVTRINVRFQVHPFHPFIAFPSTVTHVSGTVVNSVFLFPESIEVVPASTFLGTRGAYFFNDDVEIYVTEIQDKYLKYESCTLTGFAGSSIETFCQTYPSMTFVDMNSLDIPYVEEFKAGDYTHAHEVFDTSESN